jgi:large subunit ribosomal protein L13
MNKTYQPTQKEVRRSWHLIDATDQVLGRLSTKVATYLMGKHKPSYSAHMDSGDYVVIINASNIRVTGKKADQKLYRSHSMYPGGFKEIAYTQMKERHPERILEFSIKGMLPENRLTDKRMRRLFVFPTETHPYEAKFKKK